MAPGGTLVIGVYQPCSGAQAPVATIRGAGRVPGPTTERALSTKGKPTSFPTPRTPRAANAREIPLIRFIPRGPAPPDRELLSGRSTWSGSSQSVRGRRLRSRSRRVRIIEATAPSAAKTRVFEEKPGGIAHCDGRKKMDPRAKDMRFLYVIFVRFSDESRSARMTCTPAERNGSRSSSLAPSSVTNTVTRARSATTIEDL